MGFGDDLLVSGIARRMQQTDPRQVFVTYRGQPAKWSPIWDHNPRFSRQRDLAQELPGRDQFNMRPYHTGKTQTRWSYNLDFRPEVGEIYFTKEEQEFGARFAGRVIIEPHIKPGASPNKQWGFIRWEKLAWLLSPLGLRLAQVGPLGTQTLLGVELIPTDTFRMAAAVLSMARAVVLPEGGLGHAAAALGIPGVVIFGSFTPVELTGYPIHRNIGASLGDACGWRTPCEHCAAWMKDIAPERVVKELLEVLK